ncbi:MAG TPA: hypothetical protein VIK22_08340, partial [Candidatus Anoxymicrobiaceae bacterium]
YLLPWFRWYMRLGIVVYLSLIVIACYGLSVILKSFKGRRKEMLLIPIALIMALELLIVPPMKSYDFATIPPIFNAVEQLPRNSGTVFYPIFENGPYVTARLMFYQRWFKQPMLNGALNDSDGEALRRTIYSPFNAATPGILRRFGINYMVYGMDTKGDTSASLLPPGLQEIKAYDGDGWYGNAHLYKITAPKADIVPMYLGDISVPNPSEDGSTVRIVGTGGTIKLLDFAGSDVRVSMNLPMTSETHAHQVSIMKGSKELWRGYLSAGEETVAVMKDVLIPKAGADLKFVIKGGTWPVTPKDTSIFGMLRSSLKIGDLEILPAAVL